MHERVVMVAGWCGAIIDLLGIGIITSTAGYSNSVAV